MLAGIRTTFCCLSAALAVQWCGSVASHPELATPAALAPAAPVRTEPVAPLIRALLDTSGAGRASALLHLQAGEYVRELYAPDFGPV